MSMERARITVDGVSYEYQPLTKDETYSLPSWFVQGLYRAGKAVPAEGSGDLPEDFPGRAQLIAAGFDMLAAVRGIRDFDAIKGIGQATEEKIVAYLNTLNEGDSDV